MTYAYIRVSTGKQTVENQKITIEEFCKQKEITEVKFVEETISGTKDFQKRKLGKLIEELQKGDTLIITELSRLGRNLMMIFNILNKLLEKEINVYAIKENFELSEDIQSQVLAFAFGLSAQIERDLISERTKMGLERAKKQGKIGGREKGCSNPFKLEGKEDFIVSELKNGKSKTELCKQLNISRPTLDNFIKLKGLN